MRQNFKSKNNRKIKDKFLEEWVSVNDRLPMSEKEVQIKDESYGDNLGIGSYRWRDRCWAISGTVFYKPTHWLEILPITEDVAWDC